MPKEVKESLNEDAIKILDALERKKRLFAMWEDVEFVCAAILAKAKADPENVKASLLKEVVSSLKALKDLDSFVDELDQSIKQLDEQGGDPDQMTPEEERMIAEFEEYQARTKIAAQFGVDPDMAKEEEA